jgi:hypothetical protein
MVSRSLVSLLASTSHLPHSPTLPIRHLPAEERARDVVVFVTPDPQVHLAGSIEDRLVRCCALGAISATLVPSTAILVRSRPTVTLYARPGSRDFRDYATRHLAKLPNALLGVRSGLSANSRTETPLRLTW